MIWRQTGKNVTELRIECIFLKLHWSMKALIEVHFQWSAVALTEVHFQLHVENVVRSTLSYLNETHQKNAFNSYNYIQITPKFNIVEFFVVDFICARLLFTSDVVMKERASSDLRFIRMWNISFIIMWPLHNQSYCNISMKNGSNVIINRYNSIYPAMTAFTDQYSLPNIFFDNGQS
jgi:hypothetical protein